jgi:hypothetical protein
MRPGLKLRLVVILSAAGFVGCAKYVPEPYPYHNSLYSPGEKFGSLPPAVQKTIRAQIGAAEMSDIRKLEEPVGVVYKVLMRDRNRYPPLYVASDGSVLYPDMTVAVMARQENIGALSGGPAGGLKFSDLPIRVANVVHEKEPTAEVEFIHEIYLGGSPYYEVSFKNAKHFPKLLIADDGTLVNETTFK